MTNAHLSNQQGLKSETLISQRVNDNDTAEKNRRRPLTWTMFGPCRRGIPHIQRAVFSSMTQRVNHPGPPLLHKNPMSDPQWSAGDLVTVAPKPWGATFDPPSLDCEPDKNGIVHHFLNSSGIYHHKVRTKTWNLQENWYSQEINMSASCGPAHSATLIINIKPSEKKATSNKKKI